MLICLGSPHLGSPVERLGHLTTAALNLSNITAPLGHDCRRAQPGNQGPAAWSLVQHQTISAQHRIAFRFLGASLAEEDPGGELSSANSLANSLAMVWSRWSSATAHAIDGDVQSARTRQAEPHGVADRRARLSADQGVGGRTRRLGGS
jgi:hypothetical protein